MSEFQEILSRDPLTEREIEILDKIASGHTNREIADQLYLALETVRWYTKRIYSKLHVRNRTEAAHKARELGLLEPEEHKTFTDKEVWLPKYKLPGQVTAFVGRSKELSDFANLLEKQDNRLLTILGPGGIGKTRLAIQVAKASMSIFPDGAFFVSLEHLNIQDKLAPTLAEQLDLNLVESADLENLLAEYLRTRKLLLILDNFENVIHAKDLISNLLEKTENLKIITTSRLRLDLRGEILYKLKGLTLPEDQQSAKISQADSVQLFLKTALQESPRREFEGGDFQHIAQICHLVGGMPLGIILAAAWVEVLSVEAIAAEISGALDILSTEKQDIPERQRSLRAIFDQSLSLLSPSEKVVFLKLAAFQGGFTRNAAEAVAGATVSHLASLSGKSLLQFEPLSERYGLHTLLRQYTLEKLEEEGLQADTREKHLQFFMNLIKDVEDGIKGGDQIEALDRFVADFQNIRAAWMRAIHEEHIDWVEQSVEVLYWGCVMRGKTRDGEQLLSAARTSFPGLDTTDGKKYPRLMLQFDASGEEYGKQLDRELQGANEHNSSRERAILLWARSVNRYAMRELHAAIASLEESRSIFESLGDSFYLVEVLHLLWMCHWFLGQPDKGSNYYEQALKLARSNGNIIAVARALGAGGAFDLIAGRFDLAEASTKEGLQLRRQMGDRPGEAMSLAHLGWLAAIRGDFEEARLLLHQSITMAEEVHNLNSQATARNILGWIACLQEDYETGRQLCQANWDRSPDPTVRFGANLGLAFAYVGLGRFSDARDYLKRMLSFAISANGLGVVLTCLPLVAMLLKNDGSDEDAARVLSLAFSKSDESNGWIHRWRPLFQLKHSLEDKLGDQVFVAAWKAGQNWSLAAAADQIQIDRDLIQLKN